MNFLELSKAAWLKAGQSGDIAAVTNLSGFQARFVDYVRDAWFDIQQSTNDWVFLKNSGVVTVTAGQESFVLSMLGISDCRKPLQAFIYQNSSWSPLGLVVSDSAENAARRLNKSSAKPLLMYFDVGTISFDSIPDANYQIKIYYTRTPQELVVNTDIPLCDSSYHRAIIWGAVRSYAQDDQDASLFSRADNELNKIMRTMYADLTPKLTFGRSSF